MKRVYKYPFVVSGRFMLRLPLGARILHVQSLPIRVESGVLWALIDLGAPETERIFHIYGTGHDIPQAEILAHVATWQSGQFMWHLFEEKLNGSDASEF